MELLVNVDVDDLEKAVDFYTRAFGLTVGRRFGGEAAELLGGTAPIYLLLKAAGTPAARDLPQRRDYGRHWTPVHLDFVVPDADTAVQRAVAAGAVLEGDIRTHDWGRIAVLADPFGHGLCILQFLRRGYDEISG
ncbi:MAG TPA: VOC family protein [Gammaproteobacteria bacterium]|jgi:predicted enzyme related to lactoylglutathione lyase|nr:VOC family protein [Gammaproteobacteria bacterium]